MQIIFLVKGPIYLVCISCTDEPIEALRGQLELLYGQVKDLINMVYLFLNFLIFCLHHILFLNFVADVANFDKVG